MIAIRIGTRGSKLALRQTELIVQLLQREFPSLQFEIKTIKTTGDKRRSESLAKVASELGGKGMFVKELESALLNGEIDIAVHSMKDVPTELPANLTIGAMPQREDARDALISKGNLTLDELPSEAKVGSSSLRRKAQLLHLRKDLKILELRGNLDTRIRKLGESDLDAIVLAAAGLKRLGLESMISECISPEVMVPDPGQGALGVEIRKNDQKMAAIVSRMDNNEIRCAVSAERELLRQLGGGCQTPIGAFGRIENGKLRLMGMVATPDGERRIICELLGNPDKPEEVGKNLAEAMKDIGAGELLAGSAGVPPANKK
jgi:hydroxymethylbilane synthase